MVLTTRALFIGAVCVLGLPPTAWSQERSDFAKNGAYVALSGSSEFTLDGGVTAGFRFT